MGHRAPWARPRLAWAAFASLVLIGGWMSVSAPPPHPRIPGPALWAANVAVAGLALALPRRHAPRTSRVCIGAACADGLIVLSGGWLYGVAMVALAYALHPQPAPARAQADARVAG